MHTDAFDPARHLISDRDLTRLALEMELAEEALRGRTTPADPLTQEIARLRAASDAFVAWRAAAIPADWRRRAIPTGTAFRRGALQAVARLTPRVTAGLYTLQVEISRRTGPTTLADLLRVAEVFVEAARVVSVGPVNPGLGHLRVAEWVVRIPAATHPNHAASSHAKHVGEFERLADQAAALTVARCLDFGLSPVEASALVTARVAARARKAA